MVADQRQVCELIDAQGRHVPEVANIDDIRFDHLVDMVVRVRRPEWGDGAPVDIREGMGQETERPQFKINSPERRLIPVERHERYFGMDGNDVG